MNKKLNILFVCKYNVFRSKVAEAYFKKINKNKNIIIKSAGIFPGSRRDPGLTESCKELGLNLSAKSQAVTTKMLKESDIIVITADDVPKKLFKYHKIYPRKVIAWKIKDVYSTDKSIESKRIRSIRKIMKKLDKLNKELKEIK